MSSASASESVTDARSDYINCSACGLSLAFGTFFCGKCGAAQLQAMLLPGNKIGAAVVASSSTADYDPSNPNNKPWRDTAHMKNKPTLPPKLTLETQRKETPPPAVPWRPTMRQTVHDKKDNYEILKRKALIRKAKGLPTKGQKQGQIDVRLESKSSVDINEMVNLEITGEGEESEVRQNVIYFKNYAFKRRGQKVRIAKPKKKVRQYDDSYKVTGEQTFVHAVAVYEADWIVQPGFTIHASLIERCRGEAKDNYVTRYFLRVGATFEDPALAEDKAYNEGRVSTASGGRYRKGEEGEDQEDGTALREVEAELPPKEAVPQDLVILGIFQNDVGRLLTDPKQYWVDLNLIKPDEYYMASYLQASLQYVAQRVHVTPSFALINLVDQVSLVEPLGDNYELPGTAISNTGGLNVPAKMAVISEQDVGLFKRRHKRALLKKKLENRLAIKREMEQEEEEKKKRAVEDPTYRPGTPKSNATSITVPKFESPSSMRHREAQEAELKRKSRATSSALGPLGKEQTFTIDKTIAQRSVRVPVGKIYENNYVLTIARLSVNYPDPEILLNDPLPERESDSDDPLRDLLFSNVKATEVVIHLFPLYGEQYVAPKIISFDVASLVVLLDPHYADINAVLARGFEDTARFLKDMTDLLHFYPQVTTPDRFGTTRTELRLGITGVAVIPFVRPVDEIDSDSDSEETAGLATWDFVEEIMAELIGPMVQGLLFDMKKEAEEARLHRLYLEAWGSVAIQRLARGHICRAKQWIPMKREERRLLREQARAGAIKIQSAIRLFINRVAVRERKMLVETQRREKELAAEAERWALKVAAAEEALARAEKERIALEAAKAAAEAKRLARMDMCWCHSVRCHYVDREIKDTDLHVFGRFVCRGICEHERSEAIIENLRIMHDDEVALDAIKATGTGEEDQIGEGRGMWRLRLGLVEALEGDGISEGQDTLIELADEEAPCKDTVIVDSDALCAIAEIMRKERSLMYKEQEEVEDDYLEDRGEEMAPEDKEDDEYVVLNRTMLEASGTLKQELFRRCCEGLNITYRFDGALVASWDLQKVMEHYQVFYDDDHDLVIGI